MEKLYYNGIIITMAEADAEMEKKNRPEALLVRDGIIVKTGDLESVSNVASVAAEKIDLQGRCMMPGFIDAHSHIVMNGQMSMFADLSDCESFADIVAVLKEYVKEHYISKEEAVVGWGYDHNFLSEERHPDRFVLDEVSMDIPVLILHVSAHLACVNSVALWMAGVDSSTPDPAGGHLGRVKGSNEPDGYLEEAGLALVQGVIFDRVSMNPQSIMQKMQKAYIENGVTTVQDGASSETDIQLLKNMSEAGLLKVDVISYLLLASGGKELAEKYKSLNGKYERHLKIGGYKMILDGSPQGRSAWLSEPYQGEENGYSGYPSLSDHEAKAQIKQAISEGKQLLAHCNGDAASEQYLKLYEECMTEAGEKQELRPVMIHCQTVRNDQLERMAQLHMIASVFVGHVWYWGDVHLKNLGEIRGNHISPVKDALDRGAIVNFHQDTPVTKPNMLHSVWCAVNRISRSGRVIGAEQRITVYEALKAVTLHAAYEYFEESEKGSLEEGKRADLVILSQSPLEVEPRKIKDIRVVETIKDGETVYCA